ncbi:MAG: type II toxin-antitoxin system VapC family toxin [Candidatus Limnocylindria bacterium]
MTFSVAQRAIVADASVAMPFLLGHTEWVVAWQDWTNSRSSILVPAHFGHEVANALLKSARIGSIATIAAMERLFRVGLEVADRGFAGLEAATRLADQHGLTVYDAAYLALAIDVDGELATLDQALRTAADAEGVPLLG